MYKKTLVSLVFLLLTLSVHAESTLDPSPPTWNGITPGVPIDVNCVSGCTGGGGGGTVNQGTPNTPSNAWPIEITVGGSVVDPRSRTWTLNAGTDSVSYQPTTATTSTITSIATISGTSVTLVGTNSNRKGLIVYNQSAGAICYIAMAATASSTAFTFILSQGATYTMDSPIYQGSLSAFVTMVIS